MYRQEYLDACAQVQRVAFELEALKQPLYDWQAGKLSVGDFDRWITESNPEYCRLIAEGEHFQKRAYDLRWFA